MKKFSIILFLSVIRPKLGLTRLKDDELDGFVEDKIVKLTDNPNFVTTDPKVADMQLYLADFRTKKVAAIQGSKADTLAKNEARAFLENKTTLLALDISKQSNGDIVKYLTSGFNFIQQGSGSVPEVPADFKMTALTEGELKVSCKKTKGAVTYQFYMGTDVLHPENWEIKATTTSSKTIVTNLVSGTLYYGYVIAVGTKGRVSAASDMSSKRCL